MADITAFQQGGANDNGKVNWRGDQATVPIAQGVYQTSSVQLAELGSRLVVGDRVYRYAQAGGAINAGDLCQVTVPSQVLVTAGAANPAGGKVFSFYFATSNSAEVYAEGTLISQSGTAANMGQVYRVKSQPIVATTSNADLILYEGLAKAANVTDKWSIFGNPYKGMTQMTAGTAAPIGVAPVLVTSSDYFWLQTYGPSAVKCGAGAAVGMDVVPDATGQVIGLVQSNTVNGLAIVGYSMQIFTASQRGLVFLQLAG